MVKVYVSLLLLAPLVVAGCTPESPAVPTAPAVSGPQMVSVAELNTMLRNKSFTLVNVHIPYEGEIPGTDVHIPYNEIEKHADQLPQDKDARIVVYCRSGNMSAAASKTLVEMGYTHVSDVRGGMNDWQAAGYTLLNKPK